MLKWVNQTAKSSQQNKLEEEVNENKKVKPNKTVSFSESVDLISNIYSKKTDMLFNSGYRKDVRLMHGREVEIVDFPEEGLVTKTTLKS